MKNFNRGFLMGAFTALGAVAGCVYAFKKSVVDPIEERQAILEEHRRHALRKRNAMRHG